MIPYSMSDVIKLCFTRNRRWKILNNWKTQKKNGLLDLRYIFTVYSAMFSVEIMKYGKLSKVHTFFFFPCGLVAVYFVCLFYVSQFFICSGLECAIPFSWQWKGLYLYAFLEIVDCLCLGRVICYQVIWSFTLKWRKSDLEKQH